MPALEAHPAAGRGLEPSSTWAHPGDSRLRGLAGRRGRLRTGLGPPPVARWRGGLGTPPAGTGTHVS